MAPDPAPTQPLFPRLSGGPGGPEPEFVAQHQKARLQGAMVEAVAQHGFAGVTMRELVGLAGVSKSTFYAHFDNKQDCFLATLDEISRQMRERVGAAYRQPGDFRAKLTAALSSFMELVVDEPAAASLAAIESLTLGAAGVEHREAATRDFEVLIQQSFDHSQSPHSVSPLTVRAIVAGIRGVTYGHLRQRTEEELPGLVPQLVDWALSYQAPESTAARLACEAARAPVRVPADAEDDEGDKPTWEEPPDSRRSRRQLTQRERIVRGAARVAIDRGYETLSIPAISGAAGVSNQTFYENFSSKRDAFLAAFEELVGDAQAATVAAATAEASHPEAIGAGMRALLEHIAANDIFARFAFFELPTAGPVALDQADASLNSFIAYLEGDENASLPRPIFEAIASGIWSAIQHEIARGRQVALPRLAPDLVRICMPASARV